MFWHRVMDLILHNVISFSSSFCCIIFYVEHLTISNDIRNNRFRIIAFSKLLNIQPWRIRGLKYLLPTLQVLFSIAYIPQKFYLKDTKNAITILLIIVKKIPFSNTVLWLLVNNHLEMTLGGCHLVKTIQMFYESGTKKIKNSTIHSRIKVKI